MKLFRRTGGFTISELLMVFVSVLLLVVVFYPLISYTVRRADKSYCRTNLRKIGAALYFYASENDGSFPEKLQELYEREYLSDENLLNCPRSGKKGNIEDPDYVYQPNLTVFSDSEKVLLRDLCSNHSSGKNALFVNGGVEFFKRK